MPGTRVVGRAPLVAVVAVLVLTPGLRAQGVEYVKEHYTKAEYQVPMRDGVRLFTAVYTPKDTSRNYPILLARTQSGIRPYGDDQYPSGPGTVPAVREGRVHLRLPGHSRPMDVGGDVRQPEAAQPGQGAEGRGREQRRLRHDRLAAQERSPSQRQGRLSGDVVPRLSRGGRGDRRAPGLEGGFAAGARSLDSFLGDDWYHNGALFLNHAFFYAPRLGTPRPEPIREPNYSPFDFGTPDGYDFFLRLGPLANIDAKYFRGKNQFWNELMAHPTYDEFWKARNLRPHLKNIKPALLTVGGWFDAENLFGVAGSPPLLPGGPGEQRPRHGALDSRRLEQRHRRLARPRLVRLEHGRVLSRERGTAVLQLPPQGQGGVEVAEGARVRDGHEQVARARELAAGGRNAAVGFALRGGLATGRRAAPPKRGRRSTSTSATRRSRCRTSRRSARSWCRSTCAPTSGSPPAGPTSSVYESDELSKPLTLAGPIEVELHVSTTGTDSDWVVKLIDVYPDDYPDPKPEPVGRAAWAATSNWCGATCCAAGSATASRNPSRSSRASRPAVRFKLPDVCHTFRPGHKIMVQVQSSWFPLVDRNPQSFVNIADAKESDFQQGNAARLPIEGSAVPARCPDAPLIPRQTA